MACNVMYPIQEGQYRNMAEHVKTADHINNMSRVKIYEIRVDGKIVDFGTGNPPGYAQIVDSQANPIDDGDMKVVAATPLKSKKTKMNETAASHLTNFLVNFPYFTHYYDSGREDLSKFCTTISDGEYKPPSTNSITRESFALAEKHCVDVKAHLRTHQPRWVVFETRNVAPKFVGIFMRYVSGADSDNVGFAEFCINVIDKRIPLKQSIDGAVEKLGLEKSQVAHIVDGTHGGANVDLQPYSFSHCLKKKLDLFVLSFLLTVGKKEVFKCLRDFDFDGLTIPAMCTLLSKSQPPSALESVKLKEISRYVELIGQGYQKLLNYEFPTIGTGFATVRKANQLIREFSHASEKLLRLHSDASSKAEEKPPIDSVDDASLVEKVMEKVAEKVVDDAESGKAVEKLEEVENIDDKKGQEISTDTVDNLKSTEETSADPGENVEGVVQRATDAAKDGVPADSLDPYTLLDKNDVCSLCVELKEAQKLMTTLFSQTFEEDYLTDNAKLAKFAALDPRYHNLTFRNSKEESDALLEDLKSSISSMSLSNQTSQSKSTWDLEGQGFVAIDNPENSIETYIKEARRDASYKEIQDPLEWWSDRSHYKVFPQIADLAWKWLPLSPVTGDGPWDEKDIKSSVTAFNKLSSTNSVRQVSKH